MAGDEEHSGHTRLRSYTVYQHKRLTFVVPLGEHLRRRCFAPSLGQSSPAGLVCGVKGDRFLGAWSKVNYFGW